MAVHFAKGSGKNHFSLSACSGRSQPPPVPSPPQYGSLSNQRILILDFKYFSASYTPSVIGAAFAIWAGYFAS
jgi:hypothetical protein